jgi:type I restriction enzyme, S subunit
MSVWSICKQSEILSTSRMDAEYYRPNFLQIEKLLSKLDAIQLRNHLDFVRCGPFGSTITCNTYLSEGVVVARPFNINEMAFRYEKLAFISDFDVKKKGLYLYHGGDIFFSRVGDVRVGYLAANKKYSRVTISPNIICARLKNGSLRSEYLTVFLNTKYGQQQIERGLKVVAQPTISTSLVSRIKVFIPDKMDEEKISNIFLSSLDCYEKSKEYFTQAQQLLESELGLDKLKSKKTGNMSRYSTVGLTDTFNAGRIDAQCFAPNAVFYEKWLLKHTECIHLNRLLQAKIKGKQQEELEKGSTDYCSIKHISGHELTGASKCQPASDTPLATANDLLLAITGATIGKIGIVKRYKKLAFSGDLLCLKTFAGIDPHYLLAVLDHEIGQTQFNRWITGSTNGHLSPRDVGRVLVPRLKQSVESRIADLVEESLKKRIESEKLLEQAKHRVEELIEQAVEESGEKP